MSGGDILVKSSAEGGRGRMDQRGVVVCVREREREKKRISLKIKE